jgi:hypothetical protein
MNLTNLHITRDDFEFFIDLRAEEKIEFIWDYRVAADDDYSLLSNFAQPTHTLAPDPVYTIDPDTLLAYEEYYDDITKARLVISVYNGRLHLNCTCLKLLRAWIFKMVMHDGVIMHQLKNIKKSDDDIYRYYKCFKVLGRAEPICPN